MSLPGVLHEHLFSLETKEVSVDLYYSGKDGFISISFFSNQKHARSDLFAVRTLSPTEKSDNGRIEGEYQWKNTSKFGVTF